ncbi:hypothetical protein ACGFW5_32790 [Streptomyces sp. NPDC048416]|uniref:hypothetical protein n=1 Tax=Streptomyces sp. NPDC048416 TaxID=3365546 RepID=UPI003724740D
MTQIDGSSGDRSALVTRCLMFAIGYLAIMPVLAWMRRHADHRDRQHMRDIEEARRDQRP